MCNQTFIPETVLLQVNLRSSQHGYIPMTTIGDRIRIRRIKGKRGDRYSLCQEQPSRASEPNQDIPEEKEQEVERVETRAETNPQRQKDHYHIDLTELEHVRSSSSISFGATQHHQRYKERSRSRVPRRESGGRQLRDEAYRYPREPAQGYSSSRREIPDNGGAGRWRSRHHPYTRGLSW